MSASASSRTGGGEGAFFWGRAGRGFGLGLGFVGREARLGAAGAVFGVVVGTGTEGGGDGDEVRRRL